MVSAWAYFYVGKMLDTEANRAVWKVVVAGCPEGGEELGREGDREGGSSTPFPHAWHSAHHTLSVQRTYEQIHQPGNIDRSALRETVRAEEAEGHHRGLWSSHRTRASSLASWKWHSLGKKPHSGTCTCTCPATSADVLGAVDLYYATTGYYSPVIHVPGGSAVFLSFLVSLIAATSHGYCL